MPLGSSTVVLPRQSMECELLYNSACGVTQSSEMNAKLVAQCFDSQEITRLSGPQRLESATLQQTHLSKAE